MDRSPALSSSPFAPGGPLLEVRGLRKVYADGTAALAGVDLALGEGMFGLLGPNGAGKTTLLSILMLAQEPSGGERRYGALDPRKPRERREILRRIGYLPQDFKPLGHLTGLEYLVHCARLRDVPLRLSAVRDRARELLAAVELSHAAHRPARAYSGGMSRRLGLAQALIHRPTLLVVDEPTAGLDPEERIRFRNLISDVAESAAVLLSTHISEDIEATCPRIAILARGTLLFDGEPGDLMRRAVGRLWLLQPGTPVPPGSHALGPRVLPDGRAATLVASDEPAPPAAGALPYETTLEAAYGAFLTSRGETIEGVEESKGSDSEGTDVVDGTAAGYGAASEAAP
jgi:ABC-2 type transport system ATP-binding protein